jgi:hypothetical protein
MKRYRVAGAGAGLVRVEVLVPPEGGNAIINEAARIRAAHRGGMTASLAQLYDEAVDRFGARCLWNAAPSRSTEGLVVVADHLRRYGGMDAWRLAARLASGTQLEFPHFADGGT